MNALLTDLLAVFGVVLNALPQGLLALSFGFAAVPTAMAFFIGAFGNVITGNVAPISFQAETITYAGTSGRNRSERCTMIFIGAAILAVIGACGMLTKIVDFYRYRHCKRHDGRCGTDIDECGCQHGEGGSPCRRSIDSCGSAHLFSDQLQSQYAGLHDRDIGHCVQCGIGGF